MASERGRVDGRGLRRHAEEGLGFETYVAGYTHCKAHTETYVYIWMYMFIYGIANTAA